MPPIKAILVRVLLVRGRLRPNHISFKQQSDPRGLLHSILLVLTQQIIEALECHFVQISSVHGKFEDGTGKDTINIDGG